jgi:hypothetical protein
MVIFLDYDTLSVLEQHATFFFRAVLKILKNPDTLKMEQHVSPKRWYMPARLHGLTSQNTGLFGCCGIDVK